MVKSPKYPIANYQSPNSPLANMFMLDIILFDLWNLSDLWVAFTLLRGKNKPTYNRLAENGQLLKEAT